MSFFTGNERIRNGRGQIFLYGEGNWTNSVCLTFRKIDGTAIEIDVSLQSQGILHLFLDIHDVDLSL